MSTLEWTQITLAAMTCLTSIICTAISAWVYIQVRTPSGDTLGQVAERTHDLAAVSVSQLHGMNGHGEPAGSDTPDESVG